VKDELRKPAKCRMKTARLQTQQKEKSKNDTPIPPQIVSPHKRLLPTGGRRRKNALLLQKSAPLNRFRNIKLSKVPKIAGFAQKLFV
jgi:hypothetical protein